MNQLFVFLSLFLFLFSCVQNEGYKLDSGRNISGLGPEGDHPPGEEPIGGNAQIILSFDKSDLKMELAQKKDISIRVTAGHEFAGGNVNLEVDEDLDPKGFVRFKFDQKSLDLNPGESKTVKLTVETCDMAPSFKAKKDGGVGIFKVSSFQGSQELATKAVNLEIQPILTISWTSANLPRTYDKPNEMFLRPHSEGVVVRTRNALSASDVQFTGKSPCMHFAGTYDHCNFKAVERGKYEEHDKKMPGAEQSSTWYDHFASSDNIERKLTFNHEGNESGTCKED